MYRKYFYAVLFYFVAKYVFIKKDNYLRFFKSVIILLGLLTVVIILSNIQNVSYNALNNDTFQDKLISASIQSSNRDSVVSSMRRADIITGTSHIILLLFGGLSIFLFPFFTYYNKNYYYIKNRWFLSRYFKYSYIWLLVLFTCLIISAIKTVIIATIFSILLIVLLFFKKKRFSLLIGFLFFLMIPIILLFYFVPGFSGLLGTAIYYTNSYFSLEFINFQRFFTESDLSLIIIGILADPDYSRITDKIYVGRSEIRLLVNTIDYGIIWLLLYLCINLVAMKYCYKLINQTSWGTKPFFVGCFGFIILYFADTLHYGHSLGIINFDIWLVIIAAISSSKMYSRNKFMRHNNSSNLVARTAYI